jgi:hypothetical protein
MLRYIKELETYLINLPEDDVLRQPVSGDQVTTTYMVTSGFLLVSEFLSSYTKNFIVAITQAITNSSILNTKNNPMTYVAKNIETAATIVVAYTNAAVKHKSAVALIETIKKNASDMIVSDGGSSANAMLASITDSLPLARAYGIFGSSGLNPVPWVLEKIMLWQHTKYLKKKEERNWISDHIRLLYMYLENKDPNSADYIKIKRSIAIYEDMIKKLDKQINDYLES